MLLLTGVDFGETSVQDVVVVDTGAVVVVDWLSVIISWRLKEIKEAQVTGDRRRPDSLLFAPAIWPTESNTCSFDFHSAHTLAIEEKGGWQTRYLLAHSTICHLQICQEELRYRLDQSHHQVEDDDDNTNNHHQG